VFPVYHKNNGMTLAIFLNNPHRGYGIKITGQRK
jgi:hypothetical protein